jgi:hypothetical protein
MRIHPLLSLVLLPLLATAAHSQVAIYSVALNGASEAPPNASPATGTATITFDLGASTMRVQASFAGLLGNSTAAHIHAPTAVAGTGTAGVATQTPTFSGFPTGVTSGTYDNTFDMTLASSYNAPFFTGNGGTGAGAFAALTSAAADGKAYLNIHSSFATGGEIRGFLVPIPEPASTGVVLGLATMGCVTAIRRRRVAL